MEHSLFLLLDKDNLEFQIEFEADIVLYMIMQELQYINVEDLRLLDLS